MSQKEVLKSLEGVLESFLDRVVAHKQPRLQVLEGINRLDDIARMSGDSFEITDRIGQWFAGNNRLLSESRLRSADINRISTILDEIKGRLDLGDDAPPAVHKISSEIERWNRTTHPAPPEAPAAPHKHRPAIVLRRGPESAPPKPPLPGIDEVDSIERFRRALKRSSDLFEDFAGNKKHVLSALDDALTSATVQKNKDALILSAFVIYYLKQVGYKVEPFVQRLKKAEELIKGSPHHVEAG